VKGAIKTYLPEKGYGFIKGDDGKDYFFHISQFKDKNQASQVCEGALVEFEQVATPKGYQAKQCRLLSEEGTSRYAVPDEMISSRSAGAKGWEVIEKADWVVIGSSRNSPDDAKRDLLEGAQAVGANGVIHTEYFKTTGSEPGTGNGTYHFTIHNFQGQPVTFAKRSANGVYQKENLLGLSERAEALKKSLSAKTKASKRKRNLIWLAIIVLSIVLWQNGQAVYIIGLVILGFIFGRSTDYDAWLQKI
jgi:cold shock CspA family protein